MILSKEINTKLFQLKKQMLKDRIFSRIRGKGFFDRKNKLHIKDLIRRLSKGENVNIEMPAGEEQ